MSTQVATLSDSKQLTALSLHHFSSESKLISTSGEPNKNSNCDTQRSAAQSDKSRTLKDAESLLNDDDSLHDYVKISSMYTSNKELTPDTNDTSKPSSKPISSRVDPENENEEEKIEVEEASPRLTQDQSSESETPQTTSATDTETVPRVNFDEVDFRQVPKDHVNKVRQFVKALEYVSHVREASRIVDDQKSYEAFFFAKAMLSQDERFVEHKNWKFLIKVEGLASTLVSGFL